MNRSVFVAALSLLVSLWSESTSVSAFSTLATTPRSVTIASPLFMSQTSDNPPSTAATEDEEDKDYEVPEDAVIQIRPQAMKRLQELRQQQGQEQIYLRMGVKSGGCSGMSYVMDFCDKDSVTEDDVVDDYDSVQCVVDPKSILYLYGLELDYSTELIGGGFKFVSSVLHNPSHSQARKYGGRVHPLLSTAPYFNWSHSSSLKIFSCSS